MIQKHYMTFDIGHYNLGAEDLDSCIYNWDQQLAVFPDSPLTMCVVARGIRHLFRWGDPNILFQPEKLQNESQRFCGADSQCKAGKKLFPLSVKPDARHTWEQNCSYKTFIFKVA